MRQTRVAIGLKRLFAKSKWQTRGDGENQRAAFIVESGTYTSAEISYWCWGGSNRLYAKIAGGSMIYNGNSDVNEALCLVSSSNSKAEIEITSGGRLAVPHGDIRMGFWCDNTCSATITISTNGLLSCGDDAGDHIKLGAWSAGCAGTFSINLLEGGILKAWNIVKEGTGSSTITFNGGTLEALGVGSDGGLIGNGISVGIESNGGTIDVGANNVTIAATVTGTGTIIKKGTGTLTFTGNMSGFTGKIIVAEGGTVTVSSSGTSIEAGVFTTKEGNVFSTKGSAYIWDGGASGDWNTAANWRKDGAAASDCPVAAGAVALFLEDVQITVDSTSSGGDLTIGDVYIADGRTVKFYTTTATAKWPNVLVNRIEGGTIKLSKIGLGKRDTNNAEIYSDVVISPEVAGTGRDCWMGSVNIRGTLDATECPVRVNAGTVVYGTVVCGLNSSDSANNAFTSVTIKGGGTVRAENGCAANLWDTCTIEAGAKFESQGGNLRFYSTPAGAVSLSATEGGTLTIPSGITASSVTVDATSSIVVDATFAYDTVYMTANGDCSGVKIKVGSTPVSGAYSSESGSTTWSRTAGTYTWNGSADTSWGNAANWDGGMVPLAGDSVAFPASGATVNLAGDAITTSSITANGDLTITGYGDISVSGAVDVTGTLAFTPDAATETIINAHPYYTIKMTAATVAAGTLNGGATIDTVSGVTAGAGTFYGTICGAGGLSAKGSFVMQGVNTFTGNLSVKGGTLTMGNILDGLSSNIRFDFDASDVSSTLNLVSGSETEIASNKRGTKSYTASSNYATLSAGASNFGEATVMYLNGSTTYTSPTQDDGALSYIYVLQQPESTDNMRLTYTWHNSGNDGYKSCDEIRVGGGLWQTYTQGAEYNWAVFVDGSTERAVSANKKSVVSVVKRVCLNRNKYTDTFGKSFTGYVAQALGFSKVLSLEERYAAESALASKWNITDKLARFNYLPPTAELELIDNATLDLGGLEQNIASIAVTGTGTATVQNGKLTLTDKKIVLTDGQVLVLPKGTEYTLDDESINVYVDATTGVITLSKGAASVGDTFYPTVQDAINALLAEEITGTLRVYKSEVVDLSSTAATISDVVLVGGAQLTFTANLPWQASYDPATGTMVNQRVASTFVWTPQNNSTDWATLGNWRIGDACVVELPGENDTIQFPASDDDNFESWTVALDANKSVTNVVVNAATKFTGALIYTGEVSGGGTITLGGNAGFHTYDWEQATLTIANDLVIIGSGNMLATTGSKNYMNGGEITVNGSVSGDGEISTQGRRSTFNLKGDWSKFSGTITVVDDADHSRNRTRLYSSNASSASAIWNVYNSNEGSGDAAFTRTSNAIYYFGALNGNVNVRASYYNNTYVIGNRNVDCSFGGKIGATNQNHIKKVGTAKLTFTGSDLGNVDITNGVFAIGGSFTAKEVTDESDSSVTTSGSITSVPLGTISFSGENAVLAVSATLTKSHYTTNSVNGGAATLVSTDDPVFADPSAKIAGNSTYPICFSNAVNETHTWGTALAATNTKGLKKLGAGTLKLSYAPAYSGFEITVAENGGSVVLPKDANITLGDCTVVSAETETTKTLSYAATVNITGLTHEHATATVTAGGESVPVTDGTAAVPVGSNVVITWTAASGYQITANGMQNIENIREAVAATAPTVKKGIGLIFLAF